MPMCRGENGGCVCCGVRMQGAPRSTVIVMNMCERCTGGEGGEMGPVSFAMNNTFKFKVNYILWHKNTYRFVKKELHILRINIYTYYVNKASL